jgi:sterol desaturase/sphingolipid hydroxylase (fatty acid hydroxylase superfamily)
VISALQLAAISLGIMALIFVPLERAFPARAQSIWRPRLHVDACFFLGQYLFFAALSVAVVDAAQRLLWSQLPLSPRVWMAAQAPVVQLVLAVALGDLLVYWLHRAFHHFDFLWRFHAVHHSAEHLDWIAAFREHPVDGMVTQLVINLPAIVLGVRPDLLAVAAVFRGTWATFVHSNVRLPLGPLRILFGAPELHHWHHARVRTVHNFANLAPWLDLLFGTYHRPTGEERYPLGVEEPWPRSYLGQLIRPLLPRR